MKQPLFLISFLLFAALTFGQDPILIPYKQQQLWGYSDTSGTLVIPPTFHKADFFRRQQANVVVDGKTGVINEKGQYLVSPRYDEVSYYHHPQTFQVGLDKKYGLLKDDKALTPLAYSSISYVGDQYYVVEKDGLQGVIEVDGNKWTYLIEPLYDEVEYWDWKKQFLGKKGGKTTFIDQKGSIISEKEDFKEEMDMIAMPGDNHTSERYPQFIYFQENGYKGLVVKNKSRHLKTMGQIIYDTIPALYDSINPEKWFSNFFVVSKNGKWGAISSNNEIYLPIIYEAIDMELLRFQGGRIAPIKQLFKVKKNGYWGLIGNTVSFRNLPEKNDVILPFEYNDIQPGTRHFIIKKATGHGIILEEGLKVITPCKYAEVLNTCTSSNGFYIFSVKENPDGATKYVGQNGVEYFD